MDPVREEVRLASLRMLLHREWFMEDDMEDDGPTFEKKNNTCIGNILKATYRMQQITAPDSQCMSDYLGL